MQVMCCYYSHSTDERTEVTAASLPGFLLEADLAQPHSLSKSVLSASQVDHLFLFTIFQRTQKGTFVCLFLMAKWLTLSSSAFHSPSMHWNYL